jgi:glycoprotein endo-alpha-1,2-mannosidase
MRPLLSVLAALCLLAVAAPASGAVSTHVSIFYYPWYGTPELDGGYQHWQQNGARPPHGLASAFFPARGLYSSANPAVLRAQMREIAQAGIDQIAVSWWGWGSSEDLRLPAIAEAARVYGLDLAVHLEPYGGRTPASTVLDIRHLQELGATDFYVYGPQDSAAADWRAAFAELAGVRVFAQTHLPGFAAAAGFHGIYTYDIVVHSGDRMSRVCQQARRLQLLCAPSVGPGYDARRAVGDMRVKPRRNGQTYDLMWTAALTAGADLVTITSYNEWHEGTQIEPARPWVAPQGRKYAGYDGAWGKHGRAAERAYLGRTRFWSRWFDAELVRRDRLRDAAQP